VDVASPPRPDKSSHRGSATLHRAHPGTGTKTFLASTRTSKPAQLQHRAPLRIHRQAGFGLTELIFPRKAFRGAWRGTRRRPGRKKPTEASRLSKCNSRTQQARPRAALRAAPPRHRSASRTRRPQFPCPSRMLTEASVPHETQPSGAWRRSTGPIGPARVQSVHYRV